MVTILEEDKTTNETKNRIVAILKDGTCFGVFLFFSFKVFKRYVLMFGLLICIGTCISLQYDTHSYGDLAHKHGAHLDRSTGLLWHIHVETRRRAWTHPFSEKLRVHRILARTCSASESTTLSLSLLQVYKNINILYFILVRMINSLNLDDQVFDPDLGRILLFQRYIDVFRAFQLNRLQEKIRKY